MQFAIDDIYQVTENALLLVLGWSVRQVPPPAKGDMPSPAMTGCIHLSGGWAGTVTLTGTGDLAKAAASVMFDIPLADLSEADIKDALGELTNIIAGNIKALIDVPSALSQPIVIHGLSYEVNLPRSRPIGEYGFEVQGQPLVVGITEAPAPREKS